MASIPTRSFMSVLSNVRAQHEPTRDLAVFETNVSGGGLAQRQDPGDKRRELSRGRELERGLELFLRRRVGAEDLELLHDDEARVEIDRPRLEVADDDHATARRHRLQRLRERRTADDLDRDLYAFVVREPAHLAREL